MFGSLPHGFHYQDSMYLFDDTIGCVFIVPHFNRIDLAKQFADKRGEDLPFHRRNLPYEYFFKCPGEFSANTTRELKLDPKRCETTNQSPNGQDGEMKDPTGWRYQALLYLAIGLIISLTIAGLLVHYFKRNRKKGKKPADSGSSTGNTTMFDPNSSRAKDLMGNKKHGTASQLRSYDRSMGRSNATSEERSKDNSKTSSSRVEDKRSLSPAKSKKPQSSTSKQKSPSRSGTGDASKGSCTKSAKQDSSPTN